MNENKYIYMIRYYDGDEGDLLSAFGTTDGKDINDALNRLCNKYDWIEEVHLYLSDESKSTKYPCDNTIKVIGDIFS